MRPFLLIFSEDYFQLNLKEKYNNQCSDKYRIQYRISALILLLMDYSKFNSNSEVSPRMMFKWMMFKIQNGLSSDGKTLPVNL